jgi:non-heme chloroperoxidase
MTSLVKTAELSRQVQLSYVEQGDPSGTPLVLLPGFGDSWRAFELVLAHLPESIHAFALTQRGHGDSSRPPFGYTTQEFAADLLALADALHVPSAIFVGHSSGCFVLEHLALDHPEQVMGLVLLGAPLTLRDNPAARKLWDNTLSKLTDPIDPAFVREFQLSTIARDVPAEFLEMIVRETMKVPARVWKAVFEGLLEEDLSGELPNIEAPTLLIWGDQDAILSRRDQDTMVATIPNSRLLVYPGAGHSVHWEEPERLATDLGAFAETVSRGRL